MISVSRIAIAVLLVSSLVQPFAQPTFAAAEKPLGSVVQALAADVDATKLAVGTTVYPGDVVETEEGGTLRLKLGSNQLFLLSDSSAKLGQSINVVRAVVTRGTVGFKSEGTDPIELAIPQGILRAASSTPAYGQVTIVSDREVIISSYKGTLVLDNDGELHSIPEGKSYRVTMDLEPAATPAASPSPAPQNDAALVHPRRRRLAFDLIMVGGAAVIGYVLWDHLSESPSRPN